MSDKVELRKPSGFIMNEQLTEYVTRVEKLFEKFENETVFKPTTRAETHAVVLGLYSGMFEFLEITETGEMTDSGERILAYLERKANEQ